MMTGTQTLFSGTIASDGTRTGQAITATAISENVVDLRPQNGAPTLVDQGILGTDVYLVLTVGTAFNTLTTLTVTLESATNAALSSGAVVHFTQAFALAALTANTVIARIPLPSADYKRYLGLRYTVGGSNPSTGTITATLSLDLDRNIPYPSGISFS
jgi:hypothetical protein